MPLSEAEFLARNGHLDATPKEPKEPPHPAAPVPPRGNPREGSIPSKLLYAARKLDAPFTVEDLAVAAWKLFPRMLGMRGHAAEHPDLHKVVACLCGHKGMVAKRLLRRLTDGRLEVER